VPSPFGVLNFDTSDIHKKMGFFTLKCGISVLLKGSMPIQSMKMI